MDTGEGNFALMQAMSEAEAALKKLEMEAAHPNHGGWFHVGQTVEINGSVFRVKSVKPTELRLKLIKR